GASMRCSPRSVFKPSALLSVRLVRMPTRSASCIPFARTASTISSSSHGDSSNGSSMSTSATTTKRDRIVACNSPRRSPVPSRARRSTRQPSPAATSSAASSKENSERPEQTSLRVTLETSLHLCSRVLRFRRTSASALSESSLDPPHTTTFLQSSSGNGGNRDFGPFRIETDGGTQFVGCCACVHAPVPSERLAVPYDAGVPGRSERGGTARRSAWTVLIGRPLRSSETSKEQITPVEGLSALSLDALTSVAYGPEAIIVVLALAGAGALHLVLPITVAIVVLLAILVFSYRQVIDAYPGGGGAYAVSRANLGPS